MPLPKFSSRYPDVREVFDYAIREGGARYTLPSPGQATHWRARAYSFRKVLWGEINAGNPSPPLGTPYDGIKITIEDCDCVIRVETAAARGVLAPLNGPQQYPVPGGPMTASELAAAPKKEGFIEEPFLEEEAQELAKRLGIEL